MLQTTRQTDSWNSRYNVSKVSDASLLPFVSRRSLCIAWRNLLRLCIAYVSPGDANQTSLLLLKFSMVRGLLDLRIRFYKKSRFQNWKSYDYTIFLIAYNTYLKVLISHIYQGFLHSFNTWVFPNFINPHQNQHTKHNLPTLYPDINYNKHD